jgi:hypothetical protein
LAFVAGLATEAAAETAAAGFEAEEGCFEVEEEDEEDAGCAATAEAATAAEAALAPAADEAGFEPEPNLGPCNEERWCSVLACRLESGRRAPNPPSGALAGVAIGAALFLLFAVCVPCLFFASAAALSSLNSFAVINAPHPARPSNSVALAALHT